MDTYCETARLLQETPVVLPDTGTPQQAEPLRSCILPSSEAAKPAQKTRGLQSQTASELMAFEFKPLPEIVQGLLASGLYVLAGAPKAKKSFFSLAVALQVCTGQRALGQFHVDQGPCFYLGLEDGQRRIQKRLRYMLGDRPAPDNLHLYYEAPRMPELIKLLAHEIKLIKPKLVVVDVFQKIRPLAGGGNQLYQQDYSDVGMLKALADDNEICILIVHHTRKMADEDNIFNTMSGSTGLSGAADGLLLLKKSGNTGGVLHCTGRDIEQQELAVEFDTNTLTWQYSGDAGEVGKTDPQRKILNCLKSAGCELSPSEVEDQTGIDYGYVKLALSRMFKDGEIERPKRGHYRYLDTLIPSEPEKYQSIKVSDTQQSLLLDEKVPSFVELNDGEVLL